jgi:PAS domain S-box-containing protein
MQEPTHLSPRAVLLIDDDPDDRALVARELRRTFPEVRIVEVADEADFARALEDLDVDVVVTDHAMGWTDGLAAFRRIRERAPFLPVVMFTGTGNEGIAVEGLKAGIDDYVLKNHLVRLPTAIVAAMARAEQRVELAVTERALRESEERFRQLAENAIDVICRYRVLEPRGFEYVSPSVTEMTGYTPEEHYADPDLRMRIVHPEDRPAMEKVLRGEELPTARMRWIRKDGRVIWTDSRIHVIRDERGRPAVIESITRDVTDLVLAERDLEEQARKLGRLAEERLRLARRLVRAQEEERQRVALEIHDGIGQILTSIALFASDLEEAVAPEHRERVVRVKELIQRAIAESRALVWSLRPPDLERLGLVPALEHLVENLRDRGEATIHVVDETGGRRIPEDVETVAFRIVQEALNNAVKHAKASQISVIVGVRNGTLWVVVEDDGRGFDVDAAERTEPELAGGFGLRGMRERADLVGGALTIESAPGAGTTVRLEVPLA